MKRKHRRDVASFLLGSSFKMGQVGPSGAGGAV